MHVRFYPHVPLNTPSAGASRYSLHSTTDLTAHVPNF